MDSVMCDRYDTTLAERPRGRRRIPAAKTGGRPADERRPKIADDLSEVAPAIQAAAAAVARGADVHLTEAEATAREG
jgi:hypothetical protein